VVTACQQFDLQKMVSFRTAKVGVNKFGQFGIPVFSFFYYIALILLFAAKQPVFQQGVRLLRCGDAQGQIYLVDCAFAEGCAKPFKSLGCLCKYGNAAYRAVQTVGDTQEYFTRFGVAYGNEGLVFVAQGLVAGLVTLDNFARALAYDQKMIVFI